MSEPATPSPRPRPPTLVWVAAGLLLLFALFALVTAAVVLRATAAGGLRGGPAVVLSVTIGLAVIYLLIAIFLLRGAAWARWLGVSLGTLNIVTSVVAAVTTGNGPNCLGLVLQGAVVALLLRREVADWCNRR